MGPIKKTSSALEAEVRDGIERRMNQFKKELIASGYGEDQVIAAINKLSGVTVEADPLPEVKIDEPESGAGDTNPVSTFVDDGNDFDYMFNDSENSNQ